MSETLEQPYIHESSSLLELSLHATAEQLIKLMNSNTRLLHTWAQKVIFLQICHELTFLLWLVEWFMKNTLVSVSLLKSYNFLCKIWKWYRYLYLLWFCKSQQAILFLLTGVAVTSSRNVQEVNDENKKASNHSKLRKKLNAENYSMLPPCKCRNECIVSIPQRDRE